MSEKNLNDSKTKKIKLTESQQLKILEFFVKTSIPRMLNSASKGIK